MVNYKGERHSCLSARIGPSVLCADLSQLYEESQRLLDGGADYLHLDVMDGHFVPNLTFGHPVIKCLKSKMPSAFFESHMMVSDPLRWVGPCADAGVNQYTFHIEPVMNNVVDVCRKIREAGMRVGLAIKPGTPVTAVAEYVDLSDIVLVMTVEPGFGGQKFMLNMMDKVRYLRELHPGLDIEVDGGVSPATIQACSEAGANWIVAGTAVTGSSDPPAVIALLKSITSSCLNRK